MGNKVLNDNEYMLYMGKAEFEKALHTLKGLLQGIHIDQTLNQLEIDELQNWCILQHAYENRYPFKEIIPLIKDSIIDGILTEDEVSDILWLCDRYLNENPYFNYITRDIQILHGILHGILSDNRITEDELIGLKKWMNEHDHLESTYPYDEIYSIVSSIMQDGVIDDKEHLILKSFFTDFIDLESSLNINETELIDIKNEMNIQGICALGPNIEIANKRFCFTGESSRTKRSEIAKLITENGGIYKDNVLKNTDYLIVGDNGNPCWAFSCYGRKIEKAIELRKLGKKIIIAHEIDFWDIFA